MQVNALEELSTRLHRLRGQLASASKAEGRPLAEDDPLVRAAMECEFMLPSPLTVRSLSETVEKKIGTVALLLERARKHEELPEAAQTAADQEYMATSGDYLARNGPRGAEGRHGTPS